MPRHIDPLIQFDVPRDWENRTIIAYRAPVEGDRRAPNLVVTRDDMLEDDDLMSYAQRQLDELATQLKGFSLLSSKEQEVAGRPALSLAFTSKAQDEILIQRLTMVPLPGRKVVTFTLTTPESEVGRVVPLFQRMVESMTFDAEPGS
ncbi:MAG: DcrB-related protein [Polyangiaceae bacterium]